MNLIPFTSDESCVGHMLDDVSGMTVVAGCTHEEIDQFEQFVEAQGLNQRDEINSEYLEEKLVEGLYSRRLIIPAGTFLTGRVHKKPYLDIFVSGDVTVKSFCHDGTLESTTRLQEFEYLNGKPGRKRVLYAHKETIWLTVDPVTVDDVAKAEDDMGFKTLEEYNKELPCPQW